MAAPSARDESLQKTNQALKAEGLSVLTDIEVQAAMKGNPLGRTRLVSLPGRHGRFDRRAGQPA